MRLHCLLLLFLLVLPVFAQTQEAYPLADPQQAQTFQELLQELRCLVCQNQNLSDSYAPLAKDLRKEVYEQVKAGYDKSVIIDYLTTRYGDFILFKPPLKSTTWFLWLAPFGLLALGLTCAYRLIFKNANVFHEKQASQ